MIKKLRIRRIQREYNKLIRNNENKILEFISRTIDKYSGSNLFDPALLQSLFTVMSPSSTKMRQYCVTEVDLELLLERVRPLSFRVDLDYVRETLAAFYHDLIPELCKLSSGFSDLTDDEKRTVAFWILLTVLSL